MEEVSPSSASSFEMLDMEPLPPPYQPVKPHWFYCRRADDSTSWLPFSREDSEKLENAYVNCKTGPCGSLHVMYVCVCLCVQLMMFMRWVCEKCRGDVTVLWIG